MNRLNLPYTGIVSFLRTPVCSDLSALDADVAIIGIPSDEGTRNLPGARFGPRRVREQSMRFGGGAEKNLGGFWDIDEGRRYLDYELAHGRIVDCGDVDVIYTKPEATWENATSDVRAILAAGALPVVIGGDHAVTYPVVRAHDQGQLTVVHFDAHLDYLPFIHGITHSHSSPMRNVTALPHVDRVIQVGIRSFRSHERDFEASRQDGNEIITVNRLRDSGPSALLDLLPDGPVYVSVDIDVLDMPLVPGTGAAEPDGLSFRELRALLFAVAAKSEVVGFDVVEVNPMLDLPSDATSFLAAQLLIEFLGRCVEHPMYRGRHPRRDRPGE